MRDIKFRAYVKDDIQNINQVVDVSHIVFNEDRTLSIITSLLYGEYINFYTQDCEIELLPYTGLKDKNEVELYEGDILKGFTYPFKHEDDYNYYGEIIVFDNCPAFGIYTHKVPNSDVSGIAEGNTEFMEDWDANSWEKIGDIYSNQELLEEVKDE